MIRQRRLFADQTGAGAAEFALVVPLFLLLVFGIIDVGRFFWAYNQAEKATQMGVRYAVATHLVPEALISYSFAVPAAGSLQVLQGEPVPVSKWAGVNCTSAGCTNVGAGPTPGFSSTAFTEIVRRMRSIYAPITAANVLIRYENVGLGFSGDPNGPDVAPLIRVRLTGLTFRPVTFMIWGGAITMPDFAAALTTEDGAGNVSN